MITFRVFSGSKNKFKNLYLAAKVSEILTVFLSASKKQTQKLDF